MCTVTNILKFSKACQLVFHFQYFVLDGENEYEEGSGLTYFCQEANQTAPSEPNEKKTEGQLNLCIRPGENANPVTEPKYIPLYTKASDLLRSRTGTQRDSKLFIAGIATPYSQHPLQDEYLIVYIYITI